jgi:DNA-binding NtrC family response regulator
VFWAGADTVIPKTSNLPAFCKIIEAAVKHAKCLRTMESSTFNTSNVYISSRISEQVQRIVRRPSGNILISSSPGMGRSYVARSLAHMLCRDFPGRFASDVKTYRLVEGIRTPHEIESDLFGTAPSGSTPACAGIVERSSDSILVIDDAHLLPTKCQVRLKALWEDGSGTMTNGTKVRANKLFLILTTQDRLPASGLAGFERGFLQTVTSNRISLPDMMDLREEFDTLLRFLVERAAVRRAVADVRGSDAFFARANELITASPLRVTMRSLVSTIEHAFETALYNRRTLLTDTDLEPAPFLYERDKGTTSSVPSAGARTDFSFVGESEPVSIEHWKDLHHAAQNGSVAEATALLRQMMITYANVKYSGNKVKIADALGVGRSTLYRPGMRELSNQERKLSETEFVSQPN